MSDLRYPNESQKYREARDALLKEEQALIAKTKALAVPDLAMRLCRTRSRMTAERWRLLLRRSRFQTIAEARLANA